MKEMNSKLHFALDKSFYLYRNQCYAIPPSPMLSHLIVVSFPFS